MRLPAAISSAGAAAFSCLLLAPAAFAADGESTPLDLKQPKVDASQAAGPSAGGGLVRTIVGLAIVIAVIYGLYWVLKQVKASREERVSGQGLGTLATLPLGPNRSLHLVRAGDEVVLRRRGRGRDADPHLRGARGPRARPDRRRRGRAGGAGGVPPTATPALPGVPAPRMGFGQALRRSLDDLRAKTVIK